MSDRATANLRSRDLDKTAAFYQGRSLPVRFKDDSWMILDRGPLGVVQRQRAWRTLRRQYELGTVDQLHALSSRCADQFGCCAAAVGRSDIFA